jgi:hypothetical protein
MYEMADCSLEVVMIQRQMKCFHVLYGSPAEQWQICGAWELTFQKGTY